MRGGKMVLRTAASSPPARLGRHLRPRALIIAHTRRTGAAGCEVRRPCACDHVLGAIGSLARGGIARGVLLDLVLGLRRGLEGLHDPAGVLRVQEVLNLELDALGVALGALLVLLLLQVHEATAHLLDRLLARGHGIQRVADGVEKLADALHHVLRGQPVRFVAHGQVLHDGTNDPRGQQLTQEEVTNELHVRKDARLALGHQEVDLVLLLASNLLLRELKRISLHGFELVLTDVEERRLEGNRLAAVGRRVLREGRLEAEDQVGVGLAVVRLRQGLLEDDRDEQLQLLDGGHLHLCQLLADGDDALRAHLVQEALGRALELLERRLRGEAGDLGPVSLRRRRRQRLRRGGPCRAPVLARLVVLVPRRALAVRRRAGGGEARGLPKAVGLLLWDLGPEALDLRRGSRSKPVEAELEQRAALHRPDSRRLPARRRGGLLGGLDRRLAGGHGVAPHSLGPPGPAAARRRRRVVRLLRRARLLLPPLVPLSLDKIGVVLHDSVAAARHGSRHALVVLLLVPADHPVLHAVLGAGPRGERPAIPPHDVDVQGREGGAVCGPHAALPLGHHLHRGAHAGLGGGGERDARQVCLLDHGPPPRCPGRVVLEALALGDHLPGRRVLDGQGLAGDRRG
mmetsp:Transcript_56927/g.123875  ORF Transcript_56927/g.123875 Transcript_56927/m.123875 type:complete len:629 (-) Transcript_56927:184-2070(-)